MVSKLEKRVYGCFSHIYNFIWTIIKVFLTSDSVAITTIRVFLVLIVSGCLFVCASIFAGKYFDLFGFANNRNISLVNFTLEFLVGSLLLIAAIIGITFFLAIISIISKCIHRTFVESNEILKKSKKQNQNQKQAAK